MLYTTTQAPTGALNRLYCCGTAHKFNTSAIYQDGCMTPRMSRNTHHPTAASSMSSTNPPAPNPRHSTFRGKSLDSFFSPLPSPRRLTLLHAAPTEQWYPGLDGIWGEKSESEYTDSSSTLFSLYLSHAEKYDRDQTEGWKAGADGILVFVRRILTSIRFEWWRLTSQICVDWTIRRRTRHIRRR